MSSPSTFPWKRLIVPGLILATLIGYWPVHDAGFVSFDDPTYVSDNPRIREGLSWKGASWALGADLLFDSRHADYWQPVTFLSRMADIEWFGLNASWHHAENVLFHLLNALLLFGVLRRLTGSPWRSGLTAAVFAVHPLHVEAVAWITERKEVLGGLFWMLTLWTYGIYIRRPGTWRYLLVLLTFLLGLMAKPVGLVLPAVLLLLDWWPLERTRNTPVPRLVLEKIPLLILATASAVITFRAQGDHLAAGTWSHVTAAALSAYGMYLVKAVIPTGLAMWHPPFQELSLIRLLGSAGLLLSISALAWWQRQTRPWIAVGWLWFLGGLLPVITLRDTAWSERFTYLPLVGLTIMVAWSLPAEWWTQDGWKRWLAGGLIAMVVAGMVAGTWQQAGYWKDSITLFERALKVTKNNWLVQNNLGEALIAEGKPRDAIQCFKEAIRLKPDCMEAHNNLGNALDSLGRRDEAIQEYRTALAINSRSARVHSNLGFVLMQSGAMDEAMAHIREAGRLDPELANVPYNWGIALLRSGKPTEAATKFQQAVGLKPNYAEAENYLGLALALQGRTSEALPHFRRAVHLKPQDAEAHNNLANALDANGMCDEAIREYQEAIRSKPDYVDAHQNLAGLLIARGRSAEAMVHLRTALRIDPKSVSALNRLAWLLATNSSANQRNGREAVELARQACNLTAHKQGLALSVLAAAHAETGAFPEAVATAQEAVRQYREQKNDHRIRRIQDQINHYRARQPCRETDLPHE
jgi:tetratricopeptide (TPR) repeat protein